MKKIKLKEKIRFLKDEELNIRKAVLLKTFNRLVSNLVQRLD